MFSLQVSTGFPYSSFVHVEGLSIRWPSFSSLNNSSTGTPGYGEPPRVKISQSKTPNDQLKTRNGCLGYIFFSLHFKNKFIEWHKILTHHFGVCISGQTEPQEPSTWQVNDPVRKMLVITSRPVFHKTSIYSFFFYQNRFLEYSHLWSSYSSQCGGYLLPGQSQLFSSHCPPLPKHYEQPGPCGCTKTKQAHYEDWTQTLRKGI